MLDADGVTVAAGRRAILRDVSLAVAEASGSRSIGPERRRQVDAPPRARRDRCGRRPGGSSSAGRRSRRWSGRRSPAGSRSSRSRPRCRSRCGSRRSSRSGGCRTRRRCAAPRPADRAAVAAAIDRVGRRPSPGARRPRALARRATAGAARAGRRPGGAGPAARRADRPPRPPPPGRGDGAPARPQRARRHDDRRRPPRPRPCGALLPAARRHRPRPAGRRRPAGRGPDRRPDPRRLRRRAGARPARRDGRCRPDAGTLSAMHRARRVLLRSSSPSLSSSPRARARAATGTPGTAIGRPHPPARPRARTRRRRRRPPPRRRPDQPSEAPAERRPPCDPEARRRRRSRRRSAGGIAVRLAGSAAAACTGSDDNRDVLRGRRRPVDWTVVCAVLPKRWFVSTGSYRLAKGGKLLISLQGSERRDDRPRRRAPGARTPTAASRPGTDLGNAALGPMSGHADRGRRRRVRRVRRAAASRASWLLETQRRSTEATSRRRSPAAARRGSATGGVPADADRGLRARAVLRALRVRRRGTSCARRTSRAGRWPSCSRSPTHETAALWRGPRASATRSRPATRCCGARSPALYEDDRRRTRSLVFSGAEEAIFAVGERRARARRPRDRRVARVPEPARGRPRGRRRRDAPRAARRGRLGDRRRRCCGAR